MGSNSSIVSWFILDSRSNCSNVCTGVSKLFRSCARPRDNAPIKSLFIAPSANCCRRRIWFSNRPRLEDSSVNNRKSCGVKRSPFSLGPSTLTHQIVPGKKRKAEYQAQSLSIAGAHPAARPIPGPRHNQLQERDFAWVC